MVWEFRLARPISTPLPGADLLTTLLVRAKRSRLCNGWREDRQDRREHRTWNLQRAGARQAWPWCSKPSLRRRGRPGEAEIAKVLA